jgi:hypothetical protein
MCKAIDFANSINEQITEAKEYYDNLRMKHSIYDGIQQDILHKIEDLDKFSLYTGWKLCKSLNKIRKIRRKTKNEISEMQSLITQLGGFEIKEDKIDNKSNELQNLTNKKIYHERQLKMTGDILEEVDDIINNINYNKNISKEKIHTECDENKIHEMSEKIPRIKGSNVKIRFNSQEQKKHLIKNNRFTI